MVQEDYLQYKKYFSIWKKEDNFNEILLLSPNEKQYILIKKLFPNSNIYINTINDWNLYEKIENKYDLICAMNVFHYSKNPACWFENVFNSCRCFWIQDLINRYRSSRGYPYQLGSNNDSMRYCLLPKVESNF